MQGFRVDIIFATMIIPLTFAFLSIWLIKLSNISRIAISYLIAGFIWLLCLLYYLSFLEISYVGFNKFLISGILDCFIGVVLLIIDLNSKIKKNNKC